MTWELLTASKFYSEASEASSIVHILVGNAPLASEQPLLEHVHQGLGNATFRETVVAMLSRDPGKRPRVPELLQHWNDMLGPS
jgi:hypothetical protein